MFSRLRRVLAGSFLQPHLRWLRKRISAASVRRSSIRNTAVWVNTNSGVYRFKGQRCHGNTRSGTYGYCKEASAEGDHATRNGH